MKATDLTYVNRDLERFRMTLANAATWVEINSGGSQTGLQSLIEALEEAIRWLEEETNEMNPEDLPNLKFINNKEIRHRIANAVSYAITRNQETKDNLSQMFQDVIDVLLSYVPEKPVYIGDDDAVSYFDWENPSTGDDIASWSKSGDTYQPIIIGSVVSYIDGGSNFTGDNVIIKTTAKADDEIVSLPYTVITGISSVNCVETGTNQGGTTEGYKINRPVYESSAFPSIDAIVEFSSAEAGKINVDITNGTIPSSVFNIRYRKVNNPVNSFINVALTESGVIESLEAGDYECYLHSNYNDNGLGYNRPALNMVTVTVTDEKPVYIGDDDAVSYFDQTNDDPALTNIAYLFNKLTNKIVLTEGTEISYYDGGSNFTGENVTINKYIKIDDQNVSIPYTITANDLNKSCEYYEEAENSGGKTIGYQGSFEVKSLDDFPSVPEITVTSDVGKIIIELTNGVKPADSFKVIYRKTGGTLTTLTYNEDGVHEITGLEAGNHYLQLTDVSSGNNGIRLSAVNFGFNIQVT